MARPRFPVIPRTGYGWMVGVIRVACAMLGLMFRNNPFMRLLGADAGVFLLLLGWAEWGSAPDSPTPTQVMPEGG